MTREEAIAYLERADTTVYAESKTRTAEALEMAIEALQERKTGKWIRVDSNTTFKCSLCGNFLNFHGVNAGRGDANYCPNCGAKMEVDE